MATRSELLAARAIQIGAIAGVLASSTYLDFDLDRFLVPKELVLHLTALIAGVLAIGALRRTAMTTVDLLLVVYLVLSAISALFATNRWLGFRALAISASGILLFWTARALAEAGLARKILWGLALAVTLAAVTALVQAYGLKLDVFASTRAPGGTLGNRNFVAHAAAFGLPLIVFEALRGKKLAFVAVPIVTAALVLTRSRAAWLAAAAMAVMFLAAIIASPPLRRDGRTWRGFCVIVALTAVGGAAALVLPNDLHWRSDNPYLESVQGIANYGEGSGHGRLIQYERSLSMAFRHALFGVGPGNWPVEYPRQGAGRNDPSMSDAEGGMTWNPWPSSDWIAYVVERGPTAVVVMLLVFVMIGATAFKSAADPLTAATLLAMTAAAFVAGMFDAVLLLALPTLIVWSALGALATPVKAPAHAGALHGAARVAVILIAAVAVYRSGSQLVAMGIQRSQPRRASQIDPGNYRIQVRLARGGSRAQRCEHARAAHELFPAAEEARQLSRGCR